MKMHIISTNPESTLQTETDIAPVFRHAKYATIRKPLNPYDTKGVKIALNDDTLMKWFNAKANHLFGTVRDNKFVYNELWKVKPLVLVDVTIVMYANHCGIDRARIDSFSELCKRIKTYEESNIVDMATNGVLIITNMNTINQISTVWTDSKNALNYCGRLIDAFTPSATANNLRECIICAFVLEKYMGHIPRIPKIISPTEGSK